MTEPKPLRVSYSAEQIAERVGEMADQISKDFAGQELIVVAALNGSYIFVADLLRKLRLTTIVQFVHTAAYSAPSSSGEVRLVLDLSVPIEDKHVLFVEGTVVSGRTPHYVFDLLARRKPASLKFATLILKPETLAVDLPMDYVGFRTSEKLNGYGMAVDGPQYKHLPFLGTLG